MLVCASMIRDALAHRMLHANLWDALQLCNNAIGGFIA